MISKEENNLAHNYTVLEVCTIKKPPVKLDFVDYVNCPICDIEIDVKNKIIDDKSYVYCEGCNHTILFEIIII
jgi:DNA-directed RNA polymerase subunit RPC12/RpoP